MPKPFVEQLVVKLLPSSLAEADDNTRRRARLVVLFSFTIFLCGPGYGAVYLLLDMYVSALGAAVAAVVLFATPFVQRRTGSVAVGAHLVSFGCYAALALVTVPTGGIAAPAVAWLALVPVTALMLGGKRAGLMWSAISLATVVGYFALDSFGYTPRSEVPSEWLPTLRLAVNTGLVGLIALLAWLYESNKDRMLAILETANAELSRARDDAQDAHRGARLVLDNVAQGLLVANHRGEPVGESSRFADTVLGHSASTKRVWDLFSSRNPCFAAELELGWEAVFEDVLPLEVALDQLPTSCRFGDKTLSLEYVPVTMDDTLEQILIVITDATAQVAARESERKHREQLDVFGWIVKDGAYFVSAFKELRTIAEAVRADTTPWPERLRHLHTLKGNASVFGLASLSRHCHELEEHIREHLQTSLTAEQIAGLSTAWRSVEDMVEPLLRGWQGDVVAVKRSEYGELLADVAKRDKALHARLLSWSWEPTHAHFERLAEQARALAARLCDGELTVSIEDSGTRFPWRESAAFWSSAVHLIRNAIDHGAESAAERRAAGKPEVGKLSLRARELDSTLIIEVEDDGRGIDWDRVRARALELGLPAQDQQDLELALFADGLSTRSEATEISGRGIGLSAVLASCRALGGTVSVRSKRGAGTCFQFKIPLVAHASAA
jgi:signal transduction histidine kinase